MRIVQAVKVISGNNRTAFNTWADILVLFLITTFLRLAYFYPTVIFWHESTYILLAQDLLSGHLPQTVISELKPPFAVLPYALSIICFGKSIFAVRFGGLISIFLSSVFVYLGGRKHFGRIAALLAAICLSLFVTLEKDAGCVMIEHFALLPLALVVYLWPLRWSKTTAIAIGLAIGLAAAIKTNLTLFVLAPLGLICNSYKSIGTRRSLLLCLLLLSMVCLPRIVVLLIYLWTGHFDLFWQATVIAPALSVSNHRQELIAKFPALLEQLGKVNLIAVTFSWLFPIMAFVRAYRRRVVGEWTFVLGMTLMLLSGLVTIAAAGVLHARRYYLVLVPFSSVLSGLIFRDIFNMSQRKLARASWAIALVVSFIVLCIPILMQYWKYWSDVEKRQQEDTAYQISKYLIQHQVKGKYVYFHSAHIGYWLTDSLIPTRFVHPMDMERPFLLRNLYVSPSSPSQEIHNIMSKHPLYIIRRLPLSKGKTKSEFVGLLDCKINQDYYLEKTINNVGIFRKIQE